MAWLKAGMQGQQTSTQLCGLGTRHEVNASL